jgi:hypothetical protein
LTGLEVDPESIRAAADRREDAVGRMDADLSAMEGQAAANYQQACGTDDIGMVTSSSYEAIYEMALDSYSANPDELIAYAEDLDAMADTYEAAEQSNADSFEAIDPGQVI